MNDDQGELVMSQKDSNMATSSLGRTTCPIHIINDLAPPFKSSTGLYVQHIYLGVFFLTCKRV